MPSPEYTSAYITQVIWFDKKQRCLFYSSEGNGIPVKNRVHEQPVSAEPEGSEVRVVSKIDGATSPAATDDNASGVCQ